MAATSAVRVRVEDPRREEAVRMIAELNDHLLTLYRPEECHHLTVEELARPDVAFFVARNDGITVACGAMRRLPQGLAEVKRMYTRPADRNRGIGRAILAEIERTAVAEGFGALVLETGHAQPEAIALYRRAGFIERGPYADYPENGVSVFMEKLLPRTG
jgi:putative acetyltransferase